MAIPLTETEEEKDLGPKTIPTMVPPISIPPLVVPAREQRDSRDSRELSERDVESMGREPVREKDSVAREREVDSMARDDDKDRERSRSQYRHKER